MVLRKFRLSRINLRSGQDVLSLSLKGRSFSIHLSSQLKSSEPEALMLSSLSQKKENRLENLTHVVLNAIADDSESRAPPLVRFPIFSIFLCIFYLPFAR